MPNLLNIEANQRVDLGDFTALVDSIGDHAKHVPENFLTNPAGTRVWIVSGFAIDNPAANQIRITKGAALLARKDGSQTKYGYLATEGDATKTVDIASYVNGTYSIYIRFEYQEGDNESRIFWNAAGLGSEFAQVSPTRLKPNWSMRIESTNPGSEWFKIGEVVKSGGAPAITDQRNLYFEGAVNTTYANTWGAGNDRNSNRASFGVRDLQTFTAAMRTKLEDIQGTQDGTRWWQTPNRPLQALPYGEEFFNDFVASGLVISNLGGLNIGITTGVAYASGKRTTGPAVASQALTASRDVYVDLSNAGVYTYVTVTNGSAEPALTASSVRIGKVITGAATITSITQGTRWGARAKQPVFTSEPVIDYGATDTTGARLAFRKTRGTLSQPTTVSSGDELGATRYYGYTSVTAPLYLEFARISAHVDATPGAADAPGRLSFWTAPDGSTTLVERMRITQGGLVGINTAGIGTGTPTARFVVADDGTTQPFHITGAHASSSLPVEQVFRRSRNTVASPTAVASGDILGGVLFQGYNATAAAYQYAAGIYAVVDGTPGNTTTDMPGYLSFQTTPDGSSTLVDRMRIHNMGYVTLLESGISFPTTPDSIFNVRYSSANIHPSIDRISANANAAALNLRKGRGTTTPTVITAGDSLGVIDFFGFGSSAYQPAARILVVNAGGTPSDTSMGGEMRFHTTPVGSVALAERLRLSSDGTMSFFGSTANIVMSNDGVHLQFTRNATNYIHATTAGGEFFFTVNGNADTSASMVIKAAGDVLIGMTSNFSVPAKFVVNDGNNQRQIAVGNSAWLDLGANGGGAGVVAGNAYTKQGTSAYAYSNTHATIGAAGMSINGIGGWNTVSFFINTTPATAGVEFTPSERYRIDNLASQWFNSSAHAVVLDEQHYGSTGNVQLGTSRYLDTPLTITGSTFNVRSIYRAFAHTTKIKIVKFRVAFQMVATGGGVDTFSVFVGYNGIPGSSALSLSIPPADQLANAVYIVEAYVTYGGSGAGQLAAFGTVARLAGISSTDTNYVTPTWWGRSSRNNTIASLTDMGMYHRWPSGSPGNCVVLYAEMTVH